MEISNSSFKMKASSSDMKTQAAHNINISIDLFTTAKKLLRFMQIAQGLSSLHNETALFRAIKRYIDFWMPLAAKFGSSKKDGQNILPPLDVRWIWHCHCIVPKAYQRFCRSRYSRIIDIPFFLDDASEVTAQKNCKLLWADHYPHEPFDAVTLQYNTSISNLPAPSNKLSEGESYSTLAAVSRQNITCSQASQPYMWEDSFLSSAIERYKLFLYILCKSERQFICVPTSDISLIWHGHKLFPTSYSCDMEVLVKDIDQHDIELEMDHTAMLVQDFKRTSNLWQHMYRQPYEQAGSFYHGFHLDTAISLIEASSDIIPATIKWQYQETDINANLEALKPRHIVEVSVQIVKADEVRNFKDGPGLFIRLRSLEACRLLKLDKSVMALNHDTSWEKLWVMQCELNTRGLALELRSTGQGCLGAPRRSRLLRESTFTWEELKRAHLFNVSKMFAFKEATTSSGNTQKKIELQLNISITPPVQAPYLLKSVQDRVTDDSGAMVSSIILRMNKYHPQQGRWVSRVILDHTERERFVIRIRVARGVWIRNKEQPIGVDWNERVIHVHKGGWRYVTQSVGIASDTILATATPLADELEQYRMKWMFSTGEVLTIQIPLEERAWQQQLRFTLKDTQRGLIQLFNGRKMQYQVPFTVPEEEEGFVTLVRYTEKAPQGKATALFNWKFSAMEVLPEEDVVLVMLLCTATLQTVADLGGIIQGESLSQRRKNKPGVQDWGSVVIGGGPHVPSNLSFWFLNPDKVIGLHPSTINTVSGSFGKTPGGDNSFIYRGTSWIYSGGSSGLYKMASWRNSFVKDGGDHVFGAL